MYNKITKIKFKVGCEHNSRRTIEYPLTMELTRKKKSSDTASKRKSFSQGQILSFVCPEGCGIIYLTILSTKDRDNKKLVKKDKKIKYAYT